MKNRKWILAATLLGAVLALGACGKTAATVQIDDQGTVTVLDTKLPDTVENLLAQAEITVNEGDVVTPSADTKMEEAQDIVIARQTNVTLTVDEESREVSLAARTVADLLAAEGITLGSDQVISPAEDTYLKDGMEVVIAQLYSVEITADGQTQAVETQAKTVADVLDEQNITLGEDDTVEPAADTAITNGLQIKVSRVTYEEEKETETIPFETVRVDDSSMAKGTESVAIAGQEGEKELTYRVMLIDGEPLFREVVSEEITREPVNEEIHVGTKVQQQAPASSGSGSTGRYETARIPFPNCDDGSHGYYEIHYSDGTVEYQEY